MKRLLEDWILPFAAGGLIALVIIWLTLPFILEGAFTFAAFVQEFWSKTGP